MQFIKKHWIAFAIIGLVLMLIAMGRSCMQNRTVVPVTPTIDAAPLDVGDAALPNTAPMKMGNGFEPAVAPPVRATPIIEPLELERTPPFTAAQIKPEEFERLVRVHETWDKKRRAVIAAQEDLDPEEFLRLLELVDHDANETYGHILGDRYEPFVRDLQEWGREKMVPLLTELIKENS